MLVLAWIFEILLLGSIPFIANHEETLLCAANEKSNLVTE